MVSLRVGFKFFIVSLLLAGLLVAGVYFNQVSGFAQAQYTRYFTYSLCDLPVRYKIGFIDPKFGLSNNEVLTATQQAADIWNKASGLTLFSNDNLVVSTTTVNFVFDKRSALNSQIGSLTDQVKQKDKGLKAKIDAYQQNVTDFKKRLADYNAQVASLNKQIIYWNEHGGAPAEEFQKLIKQGQDLQKQQAILQAHADTLNATGKELNISTQDFNADIGVLNNTISNFDNAIAQKPEEGLYDGPSKTITIYFADNNSELVHTLAHELGHALGLHHNNNQHSIMYPSSTKTLVPSADDLAAVNLICSVRYFNLPWQAKNYR